MKKQFKSESKRLLDLMINSIYTNKDIFLRELISNCSDAIDKLYYRSLTDKKVKVNKDELEIRIEKDEDKRILTIVDNGIGMNKEELENNLGTIAKSGSLAFKEEFAKKKDIDIIGQFGVGFYSAFMVSSKIEVISKSVDSDEAYIWSSTGADGYSITKTEYDKVGTKIILYLKEDTEEENYSNYLDEYTLKSLIKKYSDYIRYPIKMEVVKHEKVEGSEDKYEDKVCIETINTMIPLWKKNKKDVSDEEYNNFYIDKFNDYDKPLKVITSNVEGVTTYKSLMFIPSHAPYDYYTKEYEKGLSLYASGVLIMDKCSDLLPDYFSFVKGIVDSEDLSLNISREILQKSNNLRLIAKSIESKITKELTNMLKDERELYNEFFKTFGTQLKYGIYNNYGVDKDKLKDLVMFHSANENKLITLKEYVSKMDKEQEAIYYASGESIAKIDRLPQVEQIKDKGYDILYLSEYVDEFAVSALQEYDKKKFINVCRDNVDLLSEDEKNKDKKINEENDDLLKSMKEVLTDVSSVKFTNKLKNHPVCLSVKGDVSIEMQKVFEAMPNDIPIKAETVLEINENHPISDKLKKLYKDDKETFEKYTKILYSEARMIAGLNIDDPTEISNLICDVIAK